MKLTDDPQAKLRLWAANPRVIPLPPGPTLPKIASMKFSSYEEFNQWKAALIRRIARGEHHG